MQKKNDKGKVSLEQRVEDLEAFSASAHSLGVALEERVKDLEERVELLEKKMLRFLEASTDVLTAVQKLAKIISEQAGTDWEESLRKATEKC